MVELAETHVRRGCPNGYLYVEHSEVAGWLLVEASQATMAARLRDGEVERIPITDFFHELISGRSFRFQLCSASPAVLTLLTVTLQHRPSLRASTDLISIEEILAALEADGRDAALALARGSQRVLAFCDQGKPKRVHYGDPSGAPNAANPRDQLVATCAEAPVTVEAYHNLTRRPDPDAGRPFNDYMRGEVGPPPFFLTVKHGNGVLVRRLFQTGVATLGRGIGNDVIIDHRSVSRRHCEIVWTGNTFLVTDSRSSNGTKLNGKKIQSAPIQLGDLLTVGDFDVRFGDEPQRPDQSDLRTVFTDDHEPTQHAQLVYRTRVLRLERPVFSIGKSEHASFCIKGMFIRPIQATVVRETLGRYKLVPSAGGVKVRVRGQPIDHHGAVLESGDELSVGRHRFVFVLSSR
jgi:pSer/pThr/pTyr-binding forkhead associated (FHA) protein